MKDAAASRSEIADEALMIRFQSGDRSAFTLLVRRHQSPLYNFALRQLRSPSGRRRGRAGRVRAGGPQRGGVQARVSVLDLALHHHAKPLHRPGAQARAAQSPVARRAEACAARAGWRRADARGPDGRHAGRTWSARRVAAEIRERLLAAVDELPDEQREVFLLREVSNVPFKEIAEIVGVPENTVKSRMRYALERLQAALSDFEEYARALR